MLFPEILKIDVEIQSMLRKTLDAVYSQREEICKAFLAKYGCEPDEVIQNEQKSADGLRTEWYLSKRVKVEPKVANPARATVKMPNKGEIEKLVKTWRATPSFDDAMRAVIRIFCAMRGLEIEP